MDPQAYCQEIATKSKSSFYTSFLFLPKAQKQAMVALYAYCRKVDDCVDEIADKAVASTQLKWWQQETQNLFTGQAQHPITKALATHHKQFHWPSQYFMELLRGMAIDLHGPMFATFDELEDYCYCVASCVGILSTYIFGFSKPETLTYAKHLGTSLQLINIIRDLGEDLRRGRLYLPREDLIEYGIEPNKLMQFEYDDEALKPYLQSLAKKSRQFYQMALEQLPNEDRKNQRSALIMAQIYHELLDVIEQDNFAVLNQKIKLTPGAKLWQAFKTIRKERKACRSLS